MLDQNFSNPIDPSKLNGKHRKKTHARYAGMLLAGIGLIANVTAIAGLITSHANTIVMSIALVAALSGLYFLLRRWGKPVGWYTLLAVAIITAGSVVFSLALKAHGDSASDGSGVDSDSSITQDSSTTNTVSDGKPVSRNKTHTVVFEKDFKISSQEGLELDDEKGTILVQQSTAKAPIDLYLSGYPAFSVSVKKFYPYQAPLQPTGNTDKDEYTSCQNLVENSQLGSSIISQSQVAPGQQYCITTTKGRIALLTLQEMIDAGYDSPKNNVTLAVKLWN